MIMLNRPQNQSVTKKPAEERNPSKCSPAPPHPPPTPPPSPALLLLRFAPIRADVGGRGKQQDVVMRCGRQATHVISDGSSENGGHCKP